MTDKEVPSTPNNVKPIRKGVSLPVDDIKEELVPDELIVKACEELLARAKSGELLELVFIGLSEGNLIHSAILGTIHDPHIMLAQIEHTKTLYYDNKFYPHFEGFTRMGYEEDYDE